MAYNNDSADDQDDEQDRRYKRSRSGADELDGYNAQSSSTNRSFGQQQPQHDSPFQQQPRDDQPGQSPAGPSYSQPPQPYNNQQSTTTFNSSNNHLNPNLFLANLPHTVTEQSLRQFMSPFGNITHLRITQKDNRTMGFLSYEEPQQAARAIAETQGTQFGGRDIVIDYARNAPRSGQSGDARPMQQQGSNFQQRDRDFAPRSNHQPFSPTNDRYGNSNNRYNNPSANYQSRSSQSTDPLTEADRANLYVAGLPLKWGEDDIRAEFSRFGELESVTPWVNNAAGQQKSTGVAFIRFSNAADAQRAITEMNGLQLPGAQNDKMLEVRVANKNKRRRDDDGGGGFGGGRGGYNQLSAGMQQANSPFANFPMPFGMQAPFGLMPGAAAAGMNPMAAGMNPMMMAAMNPMMLMQMQMMNPMFNPALMAQQQQQQQQSSISPQMPAQNSSQRNTARSSTQQQASRPSNTNADDLYGDLADTSKPELKSSNSDTQQPAAPAGMPAVGDYMAQQLLAFKAMTPDMQQMYVQQVQSLGYDAKPFMDAMSSGGGSNAPSYGQFNMSMGSGMGMGMRQQQPYQQRQQHPLNSVPLYVKGIAADATDDEVRQLFEQAGDVASIAVNRHRVVRGDAGPVNTDTILAFVNMWELDGAERAIQQYNGMEWKGSRLLVEHKKKSTKSRYQ